MTSLKQQKEAFVTGHEGTTPWELFLVCLAAPMGVWLYQLLSAWNAHSNDAINVVIEAVVLLFPMTLCQTSLLYPWGIGMLGFEVLLGLILTLKRQGPTTMRGEEPSSVSRSGDCNQEVSSSGYLAFLTSYRSSVLYLTFIAILAVDFHVFPRRFAKTEKEGYGLMDLGASSFVTAAGLVSPRAKNDNSKILTMKAFWRMLPLVGMGLLRLVTTKGLEYQEHVSEYGVHWNFFFTLALVSPLAATMPVRWETPTIIMAVYQWFLTKEGLQEYTEDAPRSCSSSTGLSSVICNLFAANREGLLGVVGYVALFLAAEVFAKHYLWRVTSGKRGENLVVASISLWVLLALLTSKGFPVSRRTTNVSFCVWTLAHNVSLLAILCLADVSNNASPVFEAVNRHGLLVFVVANLLTGLINLSINTLEVGKLVALLIIFVYMCVIGAFSLLVDNKMRRFMKYKTKQKTD
jgi:phosphatidylinositol glycan class W